MKISEKIKKIVAKAEKTFDIQNDEENMLALCILPIDETLFQVFFVQSTRKPGDFSWSNTYYINNNGTELVAEGETLFDALTDMSDELNMIAESKSLHTNPKDIVMVNGVKYIRAKE